MTHKELHGWARVQVHLGRISGENISTRGWSYNDLVDGIIASGPAHKDVLIDTMDAMTEIGVSAINYLKWMGQHNDT